MNERRRAASRVTIIGGVSLGKRRTASFSLDSRSPRGSLISRVLPRARSSSKRREEVVEIERRILAHEDHVELVQEHLRLRPEDVVIALHPAHSHRPGRRRRAVVFQAQVAWLAEPVLVAAHTGLQHQREGRIAGDLDPGQRIHHVEEFHAPSLALFRAGSSPCNMAGFLSGRPGVPGLVPGGQQVLEVVFAHAVIQRGSVDAQRAGGVRDVALGAFHRGHDLVAFLVRDSLVKGTATFAAFGRAGDGAGTDLRRGGGGGAAPEIQIRRRPEWPRAPGSARAR